MYLISAKRYENAGVNFLKIRKNDEIWVSMKNIYGGLGVKNLSDLVLKEMYGNYGKKNLTNEQNIRFKMTEREYFERHDNLSDNELTKKIIQNSMSEMML